MQEDILHRLRNLDAALITKHDSPLILQKEMIILGIGELFFENLKGNTLEFSISPESPEVDKNYL